MAWRGLAMGVVASALSACAVDQQYSQTQLNALQTREFQASFDKTFDATVSALFDLGYAIRTSDKRGGLITGGRTGGSMWAGVHEQGVQVKLEQGGARTSVRVSTVSHGQTRVDKDRIDELLNQIDRVLVGSPSGGK